MDITSVKSQGSSFQQVELKKSTGLTLVFEPGYSGHRSEYIIHLLQFITREKKMHHKYVFALDYKIRELIDPYLTGACTVIYQDFTGQKRNSIVRSFYHWKLLSALVSRNKSIQEIIFMEMDPYLILISSPEFRKHHLTVRGILFQPYIHFEQAGNSWIVIRNKYKNLLLQKLSIRLNKDIGKIFILNDHEGVTRMNKRAPVFHYLPDPIQPLKKVISSTLENEVTKKYSITGDKIIILLFGGIDERKNVINLINSLHYLPEETSGKYHLIIAGKFNPAVREKFISHIQKNTGKFSISYYDGFISNEERDILFSNAAIIFMAYINFFSSSGVIGHAMNYGKPVIISDKGLVSRVIAHYEIGITVNPQDPKAIAASIRRLTSPDKSMVPATENFIKEHSPESFSRHLLS